MLIQWDDDLLTGYDLVDFQHKELFARLSRLIEAVWEGKGEQGAIQTLDFLGDYVVEHFSAEESLMEQYEYPLRASHKAIHEQFVAGFLDLRKQFEAEGMNSDLTLKVMDEVSGWLRNHIRHSDKMMVDFVRIRSEGKKESAKVEELLDRDVVREYDPVPELPKPSTGGSWKALVGLMVAAAILGLVWLLKF